MKTIEAKALQRRGDRVRDGHRSVGRWHTCGRARCYRRLCTTSRASWRQRNSPTGPLDNRGRQPASCRCTSRRRPARAGHERELGRRSPRHALAAVEKAAAIETPMPFVNAEVTEVRASESSCTTAPGRFQYRGSRSPRRRSHDDNSVTLAFEGDTRARNRCSKKVVTTGNQITHRTR